MPQRGRWSVTTGCSVLLMVLASSGCQHHRIKMVSVPVILQEDCNCVLAADQLPEACAVPVPEPVCRKPAAPLAKAVPCGEVRVRLHRLHCRAVHLQRGLPLEACELPLRCFKPAEQIELHTIECPTPEAVSETTCGVDAPPDGDDYTRRLHCSRHCNVY